MMYAHVFTPNKLHFFTLPSCPSKNPSLQLFSSSEDILTKYWEGTDNLQEIGKE